MTTSWPVLGGFGELGLLWLANWASRRVLLLANPWIKSRDGRKRGGHPCFCCALHSTFSSFSVCRRPGHGLLFEDQPVSHPLQDSLQLPGAADPRRVPSPGCDVSGTVHAWYWRGSRNGGGGRERDGKCALKQIQVTKGRSQNDCQNNQTSHK